MIEKTLLARLSSADTDEMVELLAFASYQDEQILRAYLGPERYRRLRSLALRKQSIQREMGEQLQAEQLKASGMNVMIVPGLLANELSCEGAHGREPIWLNAQAMMNGSLRYLRLAESGLTDAEPDYPVRVTGLMKRDYGELILTLAQQRKVHIFTYDWRKSLALAATQLQARIDECFAEGTQVTLVAVAEGGIVARLYMARHHEHWNRRCGRLITLGTPHWGSPVFVRALAGHLDVVRWADLLDITQNWQDFLSLVRSFPSLYQLLPSANLPENAAFYESNTYGGGSVIRQNFLDTAREIQRFLPNAVNPARMLSVVGYNRLTTVGVELDAFQQAMKQPRATPFEPGEMNKLYKFGDGDGSTPRASAELCSRNGEAVPVPTYYVDVSRHEMLASPLLLRSLDSLLDASFEDEETWVQVGQNLGLRMMDEAKASLLQAREHERDNLATREWQETRRRLERSARKLQRSSRADAPYAKADDARLIENIMLRHLSAGTLGGYTTPSSPTAPFAPPTIELDVVLGDISKFGLASSSGPRVDAIAVGQYIGTTPQSALQALDKAISASSTRTLIADLCQSDVIRGDLATLFLLPDPRPAGAAQQRVIAIAGMGLPGRFGPPELTLLARELCWTLGRLGKKHLAAVLIGSGQNNINTPDAIRAWVRGIKLAITGVDEQVGGALKKITFVEFDPQKLPLIDQTLKQIEQEMRERKRMEIIYTPFTDEELKQIQASARKRLQQEIQRLMQKDQPQNGENPPEPPPVRITVEVEDDTYRFGAITSTASMPEREIQLDPDLVLKVNDDLAASIDLGQQQQQGEFLAHLLFPQEFRADLSGGVPLILTVDATTARIHWELLALTEQQLLGNGPGEPEQSKPCEDLDLFLGIACGLTRQLRSPFARRPDPLPPAQRVLRVLVVADPAADARLPGAEEEGDAVADLLETFNVLTPAQNRIEVVRLIGPAEATRERVLQHLVTRSYDVLHFAGHCVYNDQQPANSGWLFTDGQLLTAREIQRLDRVPSLVFSNACESGKTPDRSGERSAGLAPTFAETFFARGVANFICTAWPVGDREARDFALALYADLIGLKFKSTNGQHYPRFESRYYEAMQPEPLFRAMRKARAAIANYPYDQHSWAAYQHYGNPYARLFQPT